MPEGYRFFRFVPDESIHYYPLCDNSGPMRLASVIKFVRQLDKLEANPDSTFFYCVEMGNRPLTNVLFGTYMILCLVLTVDEVSL